MIKEVAGILAEIAPGEGYKFYDRVAGEIDNKYMARFKKAVNKLTVIGDEETADVYRQLWHEEFMETLPSMVIRRAMVEAQLQHTKKQLLDLMEGQ